MMDTERFSIEADPTFEDVRFLEDRLYEYNVEKTGADDGQWLVIFLRNAQQTIYAGLEGWTWCASCHIRTVWVHKDLRGQGIGTKLLQAASRKRGGEAVSS
jgi:GNAT superfamily N-acetyltransferase